ncbi:ATP-binding protein [Actinophytocola sp.]|uniref:ATP-binding protein n=1 Tax=Actinophytocola sp. TaxID=1872138 RepID=UPI003899AE3E
MEWHFVGRNRHAEIIRDRLRRPGAGPLVVVGEPRIGRTTLVTRALRSQLDEERDQLFELRPGNGRPFSSLRHALPPGTPTTGADAQQVAELLSAQAGGRRPVVLADDAHRADPASMLVLLWLHRHRGAFLLLTHPGADADVRPDPLDCLRYEPGFEYLELPPLSLYEVRVLLAGMLGGPARSATSDALHAATGGNPGLLRDLVLHQALRDHMVQVDGKWALGDTITPGTVLTCRGAEHLLSAVRAAWRELALDRVDDLCRLATWSGLAEHIALIRASVLTFRGRFTEALAMLDEPVDVSTRPHAALMRAVCLGIGLGRTEEALAVLTAAQQQGVLSRTRSLAYQGWLLSLSGRMEEAMVVLTDREPHTDREATLFVNLASALLALASGRSTEAVGFLRRTLAGAEGVRDALPWLTPYLTAYLIDALLLAGRITEATKLAVEFHAAVPSSGWGVVVALATTDVRAPAVALTR